MQGSKILPGKVYGLDRGNRLVRFNVDAVIQRRDRADGSPHDYKSFVEGFILEDRDDGEMPERLTIPAKSLLGPYQDIVELRERAAAERAERDAKEEERKRRQHVVRRWLYDLVKGQVPEEDNHRQLFRTSYSGVDISTEGVNALIAVIEGKDNDNGRLT
jgi:hypothetical protein